MVPQLQRESPQHSTAYQSHHFSAADLDPGNPYPQGMVVSPHSDTDGSAFSLGSASDDGMDEEGGKLPAAYDLSGSNVDEWSRAGLLRPGALLSDGPLAEDREIV